MPNAKKIVVLGANGQLGSDLMKVLGQNDDYELIASNHHDLDATSPEVATQLSQYAKVDFIINCIAVTNVDGCEDNPDNAFQINSAFAVRLAQFCHQHEITLFHISTDYVFDGTLQTPYTENSPANPLSVYGLSKYAGDIAVQNYAKKYFILRVSSLFGIAGAAGKGGNFITTMLRLAVEKDSWTVIDDQWTCPTHTLDVARAIKALLDQNCTEYGIYNCVSSTHCSWFEFTQDILRLSRNNPAKVKPISYKNYAFKAQRPQSAILDSTKIHKYYQMPSYEVALREYLDLKMIG